VPHGFILKHKRFAPIMTSRDCPFSCAYCASCNFWRQKIRYRSPKNVVDEIQHLQEKFGIKEIHFWDDNLTLRQSHNEAICREILKRKIKIAMKTPNGIRVDTLNEKVLKLMKAAGF